MSPHTSIFFPNSRTNYQDLFPKKSKKTLARIDLFQLGDIIEQELLDDAFPSDLSHPFLLSPFDREDSRKCCSACVHHVLLDHVEQFSPEDFGTTRQFGTRHTFLSFCSIARHHPPPPSSKTRVRPLWKRGTIRDSGDLCKAVKRLKIFARWTIE